VSQDAAEIAVANAAAAEVLEALRGLPEEQRVALVLVDAEGYSVAEAAAMVGVPVGTIKSRCSRGRARLAVTLAHLRPGVARAPGTTGPEGPEAGSRPGRGNPRSSADVQAPDGGGRSSKGGTA
jgi:RNA polymerase sigma-70 factor (ECF subfamily)